MSDNNFYVQRKQSTPSLSPPPPKKKDKHEPKGTIWIQSKIIMQTQSETLHYGKRLA